MKIRVKEVENQYVEFFCTVGAGIAKCSQQNLVNGMICDVEIDINVTLKLGTNAEKNLDNNLYIQNEENINLINGLVENIDDDDIICLRLANDCIIMIEYEECEIFEGDILLIKIRKEDLEVTLIGI